MRWWGEWLS